MISERMRTERKDHCIRGMGVLWGTSFPFLFQIFLCFATVVAPGRGGRRRGKEKKNNNTAYSHYKNQQMKSVKVYGGGKNITAFSFWPLEKRVVVRLFRKEV